MRRTQGSQEPDDGGGTHSTEESYGRKPKIEWSVTQQTNDH